MAINKNFVVKNGLEVNTNLILADADRNKVGIGSTTPRTELDVRGGIAATDLNITGVATITTLRATTGIVTNYDGVNLNVSGVGTIAIFESTTSTITNLNATNLDATNLDVSGIGTIATLVATSAQVSNLNATGVTTIASLSITDTTFERLIVTDYSNLAGITTIDNATGTNLSFSGVGTIGSLQVNSGVVTATSGIITYYGDGAYLQNISVGAGIGIGSTGGLVGYGATFINFYGAGVSTAYYDENTGIATIFFQGSVGIITGLQNVIFNAGTVGAPSISFEGDSDTGFYSPAANQVAATVGGSQVLRFNPGGVTVTGVVTATSFTGDGSGLTGVAATDNIQTSTPARFLDNVAISGITTVGTALTITDSLLDGGVSLRILGQNLKVSGVATAQDFDALSDINFKENVNTVDAALDKVNQLRGVSFNWKESGDASYGVIAQELESVLPELVHGDNPKRVNYNGIIGVLIESIKELSARLDEFESKNL